MIFHQNDVKPGKPLFWMKVLISGVSVWGRIFSPSPEFFWLNWPRSPGGIWQQIPGKWRTDSIVDTQQKGKKWNIWTWRLKISTFWKNWKIYRGKDDIGIRSMALKRVRVITLCKLERAGRTQQQEIKGKI